MAMDPAACSPPGHAGCRASPRAMALGASLGDTGAWGSEDMETAGPAALVPDTVYVQKSPFLPSAWRTHFSPILVCKAE